MNTSFEAGCIARRRGLLSTANPYRYGSLLHDEWYAGWDFVNESMRKENAT